MAIQSVLTAPRRGRMLAVAGLAAMLSACGSVTDPHTGIRFLSAPELTDTAMARSAVPVVLEVRDSHGGFVVPSDAIVEVTDASGTIQVSSPPALVTGTQGVEGWIQAIVPIESGGTARFWIQMGAKAGRARVTVRAYDVTSTMELTIVPGHAAKIRAQPADTMAYVGSSYSLHATVTDQWGNDRTDAVQMTAGAGVTLAAGAPGSATITPTAVGRRVVQLASGGVSGQAPVSVPPKGLLVAISGPMYFESVIATGVDGSQWQTLASLQTYSQRTEPQCSTSGTEMVYHTQGAAGIVAYRIGYMSGVGRVGGFDFAVHDGAPPSQIHPRFSRDGRWLFYAAGQDVRTTVIWRAAADGTGSVQVGTSTDWYDTQVDPSPSRDGSRVAYVGQISEGTAIRPVIRVLDASTGTVVPLDIHGSAPRWSPTADRIAYLSDAGEVVLVDPDGANARVLAAPGRTYGGGLDWSPDGRWLVALHAERPELIQAETGETLPLPFTNAMEQPAWCQLTP